MDPESKKFGRGPRELGGAVDLINHYKLWPHHEFFCKRSLNLSISETHYLHNVVGDTEIRKGDGMELDQLFKNSYLGERNVRLHPFDLDILSEAFQMRDSTPIELPPGEKGIPTAVPKSKSESKSKERKHKKHKDRDKDKEKDHKKHKHRHKDRSDKDKDKDKDKSKSGHQEPGNEHTKKQQDKKRKHDGNGDASDLHRHQKSERKKAKINEMGMLKMAG